MNDKSTQKKQDYLDWMYEKFCASSKAYVSAVKAVLGSQSKVNAVEIFEKAIDLLSQDFPDPTSIDEQAKDEVGDGNDLNSLKDRIAQIEKQLKEAQNKSSTLESDLESVRQEAQNKSSTLESNLESVRQEAQILESHLNSTTKKNLRLDAKIDALKDTVVTLVSETKELTTVSKQNSANIQGLRKLHVLLKQKNQTAAAATATAAATAAVTPSPTAATASAMSRPLKGVRQRTNFTAKVAKDQSTPHIGDVQLLPGGRFLLADWPNSCVKLFDTKGQHLNILQCRKAPYCLAMLDSSGASKCITVAVTLPDGHAIDILEVVDVSIKVKKTIQTSRQYDAVAAVNMQTLAVAGPPHYVNFRIVAAGIDLIDIDGRVLRQICSSVCPLKMDATEDGQLICSTMDNKIARVQVDSSAVLFNNSVPHIGNPWGVAIASDGSILATDTSQNTLHLVSSQGAWTKRLCDYGLYDNGGDSNDGLHDDGAESNDGLYYDGGDSNDHLYDDGGDNNDGLYDDGGHNNNGLHDDGGDSNDGLYDDGDDSDDGLYDDGDDRIVMMVYMMWW
ncbi:protein kinase pk4 [Plakobranchus ocellatus]|uniref:Protein kinase pk4 n=1 Tax=Plakobranchus ocellatus TaxID=259542 RepID=A0AAV4CCH3_9GAST|nr:protein kinase pk4 [Plakobranchus ocellatus]